MYSKESLLNDLELLEINNKGTLIVHSSMKSIGEVKGGADTVLDVLIQYMSEGLLVLPTHTWATINKNNPNFDVNKSPSCVGILPELFRQRSGVVRSLHPTHSVAVIGKGAEEFIAGNEYVQTPCARESPWGKLLDYQATIMLLGVDLTKNTFIHGVEEWANIPGRLSDEAIDLYVKKEDGSNIKVPSRHHIGEIWSDYFGKVEDYFLEKKVMRLGRLGDAQVRICDSVSCTELLFQMLRINPDLFSNNSPLNRGLYP